MGYCGRRGMLVVALLVIGRASADEPPPGMVEVQTPPPTPPAAAQLVAPAEHGPRFSFDAASRGVCFGIGATACYGGEQFGFGMKYGGAHVGVLFGDTGVHQTYLAVAPFFGGELGTRFYALAHRGSFEFSMAGRATLDLFINVSTSPDGGQSILFLAAVGPNLRFAFGQRFAMFFRVGVGFDAGGSVGSGDARSGISLAGDSELGLSVRF
ncbi:MAG: hypothetical protein JWM53_160 [bacterium]|nr:hypothetical protein [bacterium]